MQMNRNTETPPPSTEKKQQFVDYIKSLLDMKQEKENDYQTIDLIKADVDFRGTKLWVLICAIFIASLGLNVNSTAVIIGAMLISPLMGPIIGFGLGLGILDFELVKRSLRNLGLATLFSILTATAFFFISPIGQEQSELLARTQPTIYDVLIAFFGGAAGIIAGSTKSKGNVIPGVAIATALMPPLCTAGFGLGTGQLTYFFGAFYLYIINSVFIALATFLIVRLLKFPRKVFLNKQREQKVRRLITIIAICTIAPSIYLSYRLFQNNLLEENAHRYVREVVGVIPNTQVIREQFSKEAGRNQIEVVLIGSTVSAAQIDSLRMKLPSYGLSGVELAVKQGFGYEQEETDVNELKSVLLKDLYDNSDKIIRNQQRQIDSLSQQLNFYNRFASMEREIDQELRVIFPAVGSAMLVPSAGVTQGRDSILLVVVRPKERMSQSDMNKLSSWMATRTKTKTVRLIIDNNHK